jgi:hypothetical protein
MKPLVITAMLGVLLAGYVVADSPTAPDIGWPVVRIPEPEASAYVDGARKLVNDNQRNWVDMLAERAAR